MCVCVCVCVCVNIIIKKKISNSEFFKYKNQFYIFKSFMSPAFLQYVTFLIFYNHIFLLTFATFWLSQKMSRVTFISQSLNLITFWFFTIFLFIFFCLYIYIYIYLLLYRQLLLQVQPNVLGGDIKEIFSKTFYNITINIHFSLKELLS